MDKKIRIGKVSKVNYKEGMIEVTYPDLDDSVTDELPVLSFNDEYKMPKVGKEILVLHLSNGSVTGVVLGPYWNKKNLPVECGADVYRKELAQTPGEAYTRYRDGEASIKAPAVRVSCNAGEFTAEQVLELFERVKTLESKV